MKNLKDLLKIPLLSIFIFSILTSCVKDIDLDQMNEVTLRPKAVVDLINFELKADLIPNIDPGVPIVDEKTVAFEVITNDLKESVVGIDLGFKYFNSLPRTFKVDISFLNDRDRIKKNLSFEIPPGNENYPVNDGFIHTFVGKDLELLNESSQVKIRLEMQPGPGASGGQIQLSSTAAYQFEF